MYQLLLNVLVILIPTVLERRSSCMGKNIDKVPLGVTVTLNVFFPRNFMFLFIVQSKKTRTRVCSSTITLDSVKLCDDIKDYKVKCEVEIKADGDRQIVEKGKFTSSIALNNDITTAIDIYALEDDKYELMASFKDPYCVAIKKYFDEFETALRQASGLDPNRCEIEPGEYSVSNFEVDFTKIKLLRLPSGHIKLETRYLDSNKETLSCLATELTIKD